MEKKFFSLIFALFFSLVISNATYANESSSLSSFELLDAARQIYQEKIDKLPDTHRNDKESFKAKTDEYAYVTIGGIKYLAFRMVPLDYVTDNYWLIGKYTDEKWQYLTEGTFFTDIEEQVINRDFTRTPSTIMFKYNKNFTAEDGVQYTDEKIISVTERLKSEFHVFQNGKYLNTFKHSSDAIDFAKQYDSSYVTDGLTGKYFWDYIAIALSNEYNQLISELQETELLSKDFKKTCSLYLIRVVGKIDDSTYEIKFPQQDDYSSIMRTNDTIFIRPGNKTMWLKYLGKQPAKLINGFDTEVGVYEEVPLDIVKSIHDPIAIEYNNRLASLRLRKSEAYEKLKQRKEYIEQYNKKLGREFAEKMISLAEQYEIGNGVEKNLVQAATWYQQAATEDHEKAQFKLGMLYLNGLGVGKNQSEGVKLLKLSAEKNYSDAEFMLATLYFQGSGVKKDESESKKWLMRSAEHGNSTAEFAVGVMYITGELNTIKNMNEARFWLKKSEAQGNKEATKVLEQIKN
ncbi:tetratricopeptide repeat protein [Heliophilum fasciatum]|uniref:TPR repeat protein n=1 Tax=Heliophilum fasciatum TaxID=35700 RepID=A0A4R2RBC6_9FIRM|nr:tetratricopeptide repeat protein [Heliophilum fasciatum]MCW2279237.1 hypothetical protein [Heliophilum fasciatum]TCP60632.1 TPR repeat protein [Heliophilum fasciatum]